MAVSLRFAKMLRRASAGCVITRDSPPEFAAETDMQRHAGG
jgi:hypothetical protein